MIPLACGKLKRVNNCTSSDRLSVYTLLKSQKGRVTYHDYTVFIWQQNDSQHIISSACLLKREFRQKLVHTQCIFRFKKPL